MEYTDNWIVERTETGWGEPKNLGPPFNSEKNDLYPTLSRTGDLYFASDRDGGWDTYISKYENGEYTKPQKLSNAINSEFGDWDACLAPDESYIVFNMGDGDVPPEYHVSFRNEDDEWSKAIKFDERINIPNDNGYAMSLSPDGKYLFFMSILPIRLSELYSGPTTYQEILNTATSHENGNSNIYWIDAKIIDEFRPER